MVNMTEMLTVLGEAIQPKASLGTVTAHAGTNFSVDSPHGTIRGRTHIPGIQNIDSSYVFPQFRGQGHGMELYLAVLEDAVKNNRYMTSDRTVSADASRVYQALANRGKQVYSGADTAFQDNYGLAGGLDGEGSKVTNFQNSAGGPVFGVVSEGGSLEDLLTKYFSGPGGFQSPPAEFIAKVAQTYRQLDPEAQEPTSIEELETDENFGKALMIALGLGGAAGLAGDSEVMETVL